MRRFALILGTLACSGTLLHAAGAGEIKGHVLISRRLTKPRVSVPSYQIRGPSALPPGAPLTLADEFKKTTIYLETASAIPGPPVAASLSQKGQRFEPGIVIIPVGSSVSFPNQDPIFHNVFSLSPARQFDLGYYPAGQTRELKFDQAGIVQVYCHLHPDMNAVIIVVPTPWYLQPDASGSFSFPSLPAGPYTVVVWHRSAGFFRRSVEVSDQNVVDLSFEIPVQEAPGR